MKKIMLHLDALIDYRLAAVDTVCPEIIPKVLETYEERLFDDFDYPNCKQSDVDALLADPQQLYTRCTNTAIAAFVKLRIAGIQADSPHASWEVTINTYPVTMAEEDRAAISEVMTTLFDAEVSTVCIPYHTYPGMLKEYDLLVCYSLDWSGELGKWLTDNPQPGLMVYTARVLKIGAKEGYKKATGDPFVSLEVGYRPTFLLHFLPVKFFNALNVTKMNEIFDYMKEVINPRPEPEQ